MFILRAEDSIADCSPYLVIIGPNEARDDNDNIRVANETSAQKMKIITIITHFQGVRSVTVCRILRIFECVNPVNFGMTGGQTL